MWQKCPICNGTGKDTQFISKSAICNTCNGTKIISTITGLPPNIAYDIKSMNINTYSEEEKNFNDN